VELGRSASRRKPDWWVEAMVEHTRRPRDIGSIRGALLPDPG